MSTTIRKRRNSRWMTRQQRDPFVKQSSIDGYRSRARYKLQEIDQTDHLFNSGQTVVDLGAAPGGWSQYAQHRVGQTGRVIAVDIKSIAPIPGVECMIGDIRDQKFTKLLLAHLANQPASLVISDISPNISGIRDVDQARLLILTESTLACATSVLQPGGTFLVKLFEGDGTLAFRRQCQRVFERVVVRKPQASRTQSREFIYSRKAFQDKTANNERCINISVYSI